MDSSDAELVTGSLAGHREAFARIVSRYQTLVCSLAYSRTGSISESEDLAQETFVAAWKQLGSLREPHKLRSWLCQILRNLVWDALKKQGREPSHAAVILEEIQEPAASEPLPLEQTITHEEQAILWRSLERIPETYRDPLVLFYREHQSIKSVAQSLDLSEEAVKQRISRGRKLLHEQVLAFVRGALEKTVPGKGFTSGVIAALPVAATSIKAFNVGAAVAKGGAAAKSAAAGSAGGLFAMLGGAYISLRAQAGETKSPRERRFMNRMIAVRIGSVLLIIAFIFGIQKLNLVQGSFARVIVLAAYGFVVTVAGTVLFDYGSRRQRAIQIEEGTWEEAEWHKPRRETDSAVAQSKVGVFLKAARSMAVALVWMLIATLRAPWQHHLSKALAGTAVLGLILFLSFRGWQHRPRYHSPRLRWLIGIPIAMGLITLMEFNANRATSGAATPAQTLIFNLAVISAYAAFIGIFVSLRRRRESRAFDACSR